LSVNVAGECESPRFNACCSARVATATVLSIDLRQGPSFGWIDALGMGRGLNWDWMQIAGYTSLILAGLTLAMILAF
jgi:hypothetical protein